MFFPLGVDPEAYQRVVQNTNSTKRVKLEKRMAELQKSMRDYLESLADHPRISFSGMMYYGHLNSEFLKLKKEYDSVNVTENVNKQPKKLRSQSKNQTKEPVKEILNENTRQLRKRQKVNYKV